MHKVKRGGLCFSRERDFREVSETCSVCLRNRKVVEIWWAKGKIKEMEFEWSKNQILRRTVIHWKELEYFQRVRNKTFILK